MLDDEKIVTGCASERAAEVIDRTVCRFVRLWSIGWMIRTYIRPLLHWFSALWFFGSLVQGFIGSSFVCTHIKKVFCLLLRIYSLAIMSMSIWSCWRVIFSIELSRCTVGFNDMKWTRSFCRQTSFPWAPEWVSERANERTSEQTNELCGARERSEQCVSSEWESSASERANGGVNGPVLNAMISIHFNRLCSA